MIWDHPRIRGEHQRLRDENQSLKGSSPHTRGARRRQYRHDGCRGIIPAYAGSTSIARFCVRSSRDHPRIRGEHEPDSLAVMLYMGSSPHTRGAQVQGRVFVQGQGIIPAYAGSTARKARARRTERDHPRIRGEHHYLLNDDISSPGSSPHTRGALLDFLQLALHVGIIPAYAGSTSK